MKKPKQFKPKRAKTRKFTLRSAHKKSYDAEWTRYSKRFLFHNPNCYACGLKSEVTDHIVPARLDVDKLFWKIDNYMPLCTVCHNTVTARFDRHDPPKTLEKLEWVAEKRIYLDIKTKVRVVPI